MKTYLFPVLILVLLLAGCKKTETQNNNSNNQPDPVLRQASVTGQVTGDFEDSFQFFTGSDYPDEAINGFFQNDGGYFILQSYKFFGNVPQSFQFMAAIGTLSVGNYVLAVGEEESSGLYSNGTIPTGSLLLQSGVLNISVIDAIPAGLIASPQAKYASGSLNYTMANDDGETVQIQGTFTDVVVLPY